MRWFRGAVGIVLVLIGLVWIGQGTNLITNSPVMSGKPLWAVIGLVVLVVGVVLVRSILLARPRAGARQG